MRNFVYIKESFKISKKYDEYLEKVKNQNSNIYYSNYDGMITNKDDELDKELRDRAIISLVKRLVSEDREFTYGEIVAIIDDDSRELEYEESKRGKTR